MPNRPADDLDQIERGCGDSIPDHGRDGVRGALGEPVATVNVRNLRLTTDDPLYAGPSRLILFPGSFRRAWSALLMPGSPILLDRVVVEIALRAIATGPQSKGLPDHGPGEPGRESISAEPTTQPTTQPAGPAMRLSDLFRMRTLSFTDASLYYDPRIDGTVPMSLNDITAKVDLDSEAGDAYRFDAVIPSKPDLDLEIAGRVNIDKMVADLLTVDLTTEIGKDLPQYVFTAAGAANTSTVQRRGIGQREGAWNGPAHLSDRGRPGGGRETRQRQSDGRRLPNSAGSRPLAASAEASAG